MSSRGHTIVVGVDSSESSKAALRWAARQARLTGAEVHALRAWAVPNAYGYVPAVEVDWEREAGRELTRTIASTLPPAEAGRVHAEVVRGHAPEALEQAARDADLLVVGSRGRGELSGMLLGSVSQYLVTHVQTPVVVIHADQ
ncbi:MAG TPA: universal stress protein [Pseudonocardia sp.]|jgi:nucleotide-binding universal stress UspA family protein|nr:universal stress protein [Pseudonocardia sp.]